MNKQKTGRNAPCPCGSGKRYKNCCLTTIEHVATSKADTAGSEVNPGASLDAGLGDAINAAVDLYRSGDLSAALAACAEIEAADPGSPFPHNLRGAVFAARLELNSALACFQKACVLGPDNAEFHNNAGVVSSAVGDHDAAVQSFGRALLLSPDYHSAHSNLLLCLNHMETLTEQAVFEEHCRFGQHFASWADKYPAHANPAEPQRRLRLGFVSADLRAHPVANLVEAVWETLDRSRFDILVYSNASIEDEVSLRLKTLATGWRHVFKVSDDGLEALIVHDKIDILFDLSGHTRDNRLPVFARKPAPVQVSWLGYPGTTGLTAMDYYLADPHLAPLGKVDQLFTEKIVRLPAVCRFLPDANVPEPNMLPALSSENFIFGSLNRNAKVGDRVIALWSRVLAEIPQAKMLLGGIEDESSQAALIERFSRQGIAAERLVFHPRVDTAAYYRLHHKIDMMLDTFPYSGGTTSANALWMGVPVLTLAGNRLSSRQSASILNPVGLPEFVTESEDQFVTKAIEWSNRLPELNRLRMTLRERIADSPFMDAKAIAGGFEKAMRLMWQRWCDKLPAESMHISWQDLSGERHARPANQHWRGVDIDQMRQKQAKNVSGVVLIGAGALSRDMIDCFGPTSFVGIYVDPQFPAAPIQNVPVYTDWHSVSKIASHFVLGISDIEHREHARTAALAAGLQPAPPMVSKMAVVAGDAQLAAGVMIGHMAVVGPNARLEENVLLMHAVIVGHDSVIGANSVLCASVSLGGHVDVGVRTFIGANAVLAPKVTTGADTYIAAGAACFRNTEPGSRWIGNPARMVPAKGLKAASST